MAYQSVSKTLDGYWNCHWVGLPYEQQCVWDSAKIPGFEWDDLSNEQRQSLAAQHDQKNDPENVEENAFWFKYACDIADAERELREIELLPTPAPSEREAKNRLMADARQRLAELKSAQFKPSTVGDDSSQQLATINVSHPLACAIQPDYVPRIGWQVAMFDAWAAFRRLYGREPTPTEVIRYLKNHDKSGVILSKGGERELWWKPNRGPAKEVAFSTVENTISGWRSKGVLPA